MVVNGIFDKNCQTKQADERYRNGEVISLSFFLLIDSPGEIEAEKQRIIAQRRCYLTGSERFAVFLIAEPKPKNSRDLKQIFQNDELSKIYLTFKNPCQAI